ncbi:outer membrane protein assembly factor BamD [Simkania negevensis]|uniref:Outer membrane protein assembly factor BamD n=1 Tax=Simkania negevensis TaxID=83561 RepID=A0ABS3ARZ5_9BACT|nr:outer membrane protein assembly factor BamD [Simkania negevensis]
MFRLSTLLFVFSSSLFFLPGAYSAYVLENGSLVHVDQLATMPFEKHYNAAISALEEKSWIEAQRHLAIIQRNFPDESKRQDLQYYLGKSYYHLGKYDLANERLSEYLKGTKSSQYFIEALKLKFFIAEQFKNGAKKHMFGTSQLPKWVDAKEDALDIYDEIIASIPSHPLAAESFYAKGELLLAQKEYREGVDTLQQLVKRFPQHKLTPKGFLLIAQHYYEQSKKEANNPDLLALGEINIRKFREQFPKDTRVLQAEKLLHAMKEFFAQGMYETGQFYERKKEKTASIVYYHNTIKQFPKTEAAKAAQQRINILSKTASQAKKTNNG